MQYLSALLRLLLILIVLTVGGLSIYTYTSGDEIKRFLIKEINEQLLVETEVSEVEISLLQNFPNLSLILSDVRMQENGQTIVKANELRVKFSLFDLIDKNFELHSLAVSGGEINFIERADGKYFPKMWKSEKEEASSEYSFELHLRKLSLSSIKLLIADKSNQTDINLLIKSAWAKGDFSKEEMKLGWNSDIEALRIERKGKLQLEEKALAFEALCELDQKTKTIRFESIQLNWKGVDLSLLGSIDFGKQSELKLSLKPTAFKLGSFSSLMSEKLKGQLDSLNASADLMVDARLDANWRANFDARLAVNYQLSKGELKLKEPKLQISQIRFLGSFENNLLDLNKGIYRLDSLSAKVNGLKVKGSIHVPTLAEQSIRSHLLVRGESNELNQFIKTSDYVFEGGTLEAEIDLNLNRQQIEEFDWSAWKASDNSLYLKFRSVGLKLVKDSSSIQELKGEIALGSNDLLAKELSLEHSGRKLEFQGQLLNLISHLQNGSDELLIAGKLYSPYLELEEILELSTSDAENTTEQKIRLLLDCKLDSLKYEGLIMQQLRLNLKSNADLLAMEDMQFNCLDGKAAGNIYFDLSKEKTRVESDGEFEQINIRSLFTAFKNFGQEELTAENLEGKAEGDFRFTANLNESGIDASSLDLFGFLDIRSGKLIAFEPLYQLSNYIELDELKEIEFKRLQNQIRIVDEKIFLPRFNINSSAIELQLEGTHTFSNIVDYHIQLRMDQVLGKKVKKPKENEFGYVEDDGLGKSKLFLRMQGPIDNPKISYDSKQLKEHWKSELSKEKQTFKSILKEEFGLFKKDSSLESPSKTVKKSTPFQIEWGESKSEDKSTEESPEPKTAAEKKSKKKGKFGKFIDKIAKPNEEEYVYPED